MGTAYGLIAMVFTAIAGFAYAGGTIQQWLYLSIVSFLLVLGLIIAVIELAGKKTK